MAGGYLKIELHFQSESIPLNIGPIHKKKKKKTPKGILARVYLIRVEDLQLA